MSVTPLDTLMAHKAINLDPALSGPEKRVAGVLIDHFNRRTAQCDPSLNAIADLIGMSRRTVMRAVKRLERLGFFRKVRHGGKFHRNSYEPVWSSFREAESRWDSRRKFRQLKFAAPDLSPSGRHASHLDGDAHDHQTCSSNQPSKTLAEKDRAPSNVIAAQARGSGSARQVLPAHRELPFSQTPSMRSAEVARIAAERRWSDNLRCELADQVMVYGALVDFIDEALRTAATDAELGHRGGGLKLILDRYRNREQKLGPANA